MMNEYELSEIKRKYEKSMRDVYHMLGEYDHKYIKNYVELLEGMVDQEALQIRLSKIKTTDGEEWMIKFDSYPGCVGGGEDLVEAIIEALDNLKFHIESLKSKEK